MKKFISIILSVVLIGCCFVGCSDNQEQSNQSDAQSSTPTLQFTFDTFYDVYDESTVHYYEQMCQAIIDRESQLRFNQSIYEQVSQLLFTSFPLVDLIEKVDINYDMSGITVTYKYDEAQHNQIVTDFASKMEQIKTDCKYGEVSTNEYILNVYKYVASNIVISQNSAITLYETITTGQGTSFTYSRMFEYILQQSGVKTSHVIAFDEIDATWGLSIVYMDNSYFYCDPTKEYKDNGGTKLKFFGMTTADANACGLSGFRFSDSTEIVTEFIDTRFAACRVCESYSVADEILYITDAQSNVSEIELFIEQDAVIVG